MDPRPAPGKIPRSEPAAPGSRRDPPDPAWELREALRQAVEARRREAVLDPEFAEARLGAALGAKIEAYGRAHPCVASSWIALGRLAERRHEHTLAGERYAAARESAEAAVPGATAASARACRGLGRLALHAGDPEAAQELAAAALGIMTAMTAAGEPAEEQTATRFLMALARGARASRGARAARAAAWARAEVDRLHRAYAASARPLPGLLAAMAGWLAAGATAEALPDPAPWLEGWE